VHSCHERGARVPLRAVARSDRARSDQDEGKRGRREGEGGITISVNSLTLERGTRAADFTPRYTQTQTHTHTHLVIIKF
jgi:hypothetical protein